MSLNNSLPIRKYLLFLLAAIVSLASGAGCSGLSGEQSDSQQAINAASETEIYLPSIVKPPMLPELLATIPLSGIPDQVLVNPRLNRVYVLEDGSVAVLEGIQLLAEISLDGFSTQQMALDWENDRLYVSHQLFNSEERVITVIQAGEIEAQISLPGVNVLDMVIHPETQELYISGMLFIDKEYVYSELIVIRENEIVSRLNIGRGASYHLIIDTLNNYIYVGGSAANPEIEFESIGVIKVIKDNEIIETLTMGQNIRDMDIDAETGEVLVVIAADYTREEDGPGTRLEDTVIVDKGEILLMQNLGGQGNVAYKQIMRHPLVDNFFYIDARNKIVAGQRTEDGLAIVAEIEVGSPGEVLPNGFDLASGNFYRANYHDDTVSVINGTENIGTIAVGGGPMGLAVNPNNGWVYVGNNRGWSVSVLGYPEPLEGN